MAEPFDYKAEFDRLMLLVNAAEGMGIDIDRIEDTLRDADAVGPILDPTRYRDALVDRRLDHQREIVALAAPFLRGIRKLLGRLRPEAAYRLTEKAVRHVESGCDLPPGHDGPCAPTTRRTEARRPA